MKISILTPIFNSEKYLETFLTRMYHQNYIYDLEIEFLICDDNSTDSSFEILKKNEFNLNKKYILRLFKNSKNKGWRDCLNFLYKKSKGDIIVFIDSDAIPSNNNWLNSLIQKIILGEESVVQGNFWNQREWGNFFTIQHEKWRKSVYLSRHQGDPGTLNTINTRNLAMKRLVIESVEKELGYFLNPNAVLTGADTEFGYQIKRMGYRIALEENALIEHLDPINFYGIIRQKMKHGYGDGKLGLFYKNNFIHSVYIPFVKNNVSLFFSIPITFIFSFSNWFGYVLFKLKINHQNFPKV